MPENTADSPPEGLSALYAAYEAAGVPKEGWQQLYEAGISALDAQKYMQHWRELRHEGAFEWLHERAFGLPTFSFGEDDYPHRIGDPTCDEGYCLGDKEGWPDCYPTPCENCDGLVHANFVDESWDSIILVTRCDKCGSPE